jgi:hypothetical protein
LTIINVLKHGINIFCRGDTHEENGFAERYLSRQSGGGIFPDADVQPSNKMQRAWSPPSNPIDGARQSGFAMDCRRQEL